MPWRTEREIGEDRKRDLEACRAVQPDIERGAYPFKGVEPKLTRADVEWLLETHESGGVQGPMEWNAAGLKRREGLDLRGADLHGVDLSSLPLSFTIAGLSLEDRSPDPNQYPTEIEGAAIHLEGASPRHTDLRQAYMRGAYLGGARLRYAHLEGTRLQGAHLERAILERAWLTSDNNLEDIHLGSGEQGAILVDVQWGGANLTVVKWAQIKTLGDEWRASQACDDDGHPKYEEQRLQDYIAAVRANRQLAAALRAQTLNEDADRFAYRAQLCQRRLLRMQRHYLRYLGSLFLGLISGYGYRPLRSVATYVLVVLTFAGAYLLNAQFAAPHLRRDEALVLSISAFHGRGFFTTGISLGDTLARLAAGEAIIGLLIEITFIATFTQRFFAR
jgi:Pentapeptide repeats (8 copies)